MYSIRIFTLKMKVKTLTIWMKIGRQTYLVNVNMHIWENLGASKSSRMFALRLINRIIRNVLSGCDHASQGSVNVLSDFGVHFMKETRKDERT